MLSAVLAHTGQPLAPHDLWGAWNLQPALLLGFGLAAWAHRRGRAARRADATGARRSWCFAGALVTLAVALVSPLDALSGVLASAHMVQHVLLILVAAPLLALSAPSGTLLRGTPLGLRRVTGRWRRRLRLTPGRLRPLRYPATAWLLHVGTLWFWHAAVPYDAALANEVLHVLEHATFLATGVLFWGVVIGGPAAGRVPDGFGLLLVFAMALQSALLSALLTFAGTPWYEGYAETTGPWGLARLADQQLAGVIMWIPAGVVYLVAGLTLIVAWIRATEDDATVREHPNGTVREHPDGTIRPVAGCPHRPAQEGLGLPS